MNDRGTKPKGFGFSKEAGTGSGSRRVRPIDDDEDAAVSPSLIEHHSRSNTKSPTRETFVPNYKTSAKQNYLTSSKKSSTNSPISAKRLLIAGGVLIGICFLLTLPTVLGIILSRNPVVSDTSSSTAASPFISAYWDFDNEVYDLYGVYNGTIVNNVTFSNNTYFGYGFNILLNSASNQSVVVTTPFLNLSYTSFTVEAWIYGTTLTGDSAIFSQCQCNSCQDQCLFLMIRNYKMYMGFMLDDVIGSTLLAINAWYHVAYVYDYSTKTQKLYLQGVLDNSRTSAGPYRGQNGSTVLGSSYIPSSGFDGYIDNLKLTTRAKSASEVLTDAATVVYFSFDGSTLTQDSGPNQMNGSITNAAAVSGKIGQGLAFSGSTSYFQAYGFYQLGQSNKPFSYSIWVFPYSINGGVLIQKTTLQYASGTWCYTMMGLSYTGQITMVSSSNYVVVGSVLSVRSWTHLGYTYSQTNGVRMYINGQYFGTTGPVSFGSSGVIDWLSVGSYASSFCGVGIIYGSPYVGAVDEFYVYRRELAASEMYTLANP